MKFSYIYASSVGKLPILFRCAQMDVHILYAADFGLLKPAQIFSIPAKTDNGSTRYFMPV